MPREIDVVLSVIIVSWNTRDLLAQCLQSIAEDRRLCVRGSESAPAGQPDQSVSVEVFVVDNASADGSGQMVRARFPWVHLIENDANLGFAQANNQAIHLAGGRYLLLLNSDTKAHPGALGVLVDFMERNPRSGAAGAHLLNGDGTLQPSCHPMLTPWREFLRLMFLDRLLRVSSYGPGWWQSHEPQPTEVIKGACLMVRRVAVDQVGPLDGSYFMYTEEIDLCYRLAEAGWQLWWVPAALVTHYGEASSRQMAQAMYVQLYRSKIQFYRKYGGDPRADLFKVLLRIAYGPRLVVAALLARLSPSLTVKANTYRDLLAQLSEM